MQSRAEDLSGHVFSRLTVLSRAANVGRRTAWHCLCECGSKCIAVSHRLKSGGKRSCGCLSSDSVVSRNTVHGLSKRPEYLLWKSIKNRCFNKNDPAYQNYGGRGIAMCERWVDSFSSFYADMGARPGKDLTIERLDVDGDYCPENCVWADVVIQAQNHRIQKNNTSGVRGVSLCGPKNKYSARISANKQRISLGYHARFEDAVKARIKGEIKYWGKQVTVLQPEVNFQ